ncbi:hypothetical protein SUGI_0636060 [Cryptomeria japonica]|nr:hypothetical protein SUGI_0636060 [Cryptomeria japonica]
MFLKALNHVFLSLIDLLCSSRLHFKGFVSSDWQGIDRITTLAHANYSISILEGIGAGIDMVMVPFNYTDFINDITYQVKGGFISMSRINDVVQRILRVKFIMGLFEHPMANLTLANQLGSKKHLDLARKALWKSLVLLKNGKAGSHPLPSFG